MHNLDEDFERTLRKESVMGKHFRPSGDRGFHHSDAHRIAEELRHEGKGSHDPMYNNSKKNK